MLVMSPSTNGFKAAYLSSKFSAGASTSRHFLPIPKSGKIAKFWPWWLAACFVMDDVSVFCCLVGNAAKNVGDFDTYGLNTIF
jgi:hypothetical protein